MNRKDHWQQVYERTAANEVSWFQREPGLSLCLLDSAGLTSSS